MNLRHILTVLALVVLGGLGHGFSAAAAQKHTNAVPDNPQEVINIIYKIHRNGPDPFFERRGKRYLNLYFDRRLADLIWKNIVETPRGEVSKLDFDPLYDTQDPVITNFRIGEPKLDADRASVLVSFNNAGRRTKISFRLLKSGEGWKIENIIYGGGTDLIKILSEQL